MNPEWKDLYDTLKKFLKGGSWGGGAMGTRLLRPGGSGLAEPSLLRQVFFKNTARGAVFV